MVINIKNTEVQLKQNPQRLSGCGCFNCKEPCFVLFALQLITLRASMYGLTQINS